MGGGLKLPVQLLECETVGRNAIARLCRSHVDHNNVAEKAHLFCVPMVRMWHVQRQARSLLLRALK